MPEAGARFDLHLSLRLGAMGLEARLETANSAIAVVGPSGSGKSTLLRVLAGVEHRSSGHLRFEGESWQDSASGVFVPPWDRKVGWMPQDALLFPHLSVRENLAYAGAASPDVETMASLLKLANLLDRRPRRLSGGEQQRVALGRALLSRPRLLLLDEPFSALDRPLRAEISDRLGEFCRQNAVPLVLVTHDERDAETLAEERWLVSGGRLRHL